MPTMQTIPPRLDLESSLIVGRLRQLCSNKLAVALILAVFLLIYFTNVFHALDYPEYDETYYLRRGIAVAEGHTADPNLGDLRSSPVMVLYYAFWYRILHSAEVDRWVFVSGLCLVTYAAYLLLLRTYPALLSAAFALFTLLATTPEIPQNMRFTVGIALLWLSLYLLGGKVTSRPLGLLVMILASYVRPEFLTCILVVVPGLIYYEWREIRKTPHRKFFTLAVYSPVVVMLLFTVIRLWQLKPYQEPRILRTIPFSYTFYTRPE